MKYKITTQHAVILTQRRVDLFQGRTYLPQADPEGSGCVSVRTRHPVRFSGGNPRPGHETG